MPPVRTADLRLVICEVCLGLFPAGELAAHSAVCGADTWECYECGAVVPLGECAHGAAAAAGLIRRSGQGATPRGARFAA